MTNLPAQQTDIWTLATEQQKAAALASLAALPSRQMSSEGLDRASYYVALDGVTRVGLSEAVKAILRGALGHAFFPSPPEFRMQCDRAMEVYEDQRTRDARRERLQREAAEHRPVGPKTPAQLERAKRLLAKFHDGYVKPADKFVPTLDPSLVAMLPDNPQARERLGVSR